jgi:hypothetical protein
MHGFKVHFPSIQRKPVTHSALVVTGAASDFFTNQSAVRDSDYCCATACIVVAWLHKSIELLKVHFCLSQMFLLSQLN